MSATFHIPPLAAESIFHIGSFPVTNAMLNGLIATLFFCSVTFVFVRSKKMVPKRFQNFCESIVEILFEEVKKVTGDGSRAKSFLPFVGTLFLFILFSNWLGLLPGTGSIGVWETTGKESVFLPILRPIGSDINFTLAIAVLTVLTSHVIGIKTIGGWHHFSKFINVRGIFRAIKKGPIAIAVAFVEFGVGIIEIIGEFAKVLSLSLRLFGNIFAGEVLITIMLGLFSFFLPIPFIFLEILVGVVQATVFAMLTLAYLTVSTISHEEHEKEESHDIEEGQHLTKEGEQFLIDERKELLHVAE